MSRTVQAAVLAGFAYAALAVVFTWPTAGRLGELGLLAAPEAFDALIFRWNFHHVSERLAAGASPLWTDALFHPDRIPLALHTNTLLYGFLSLPVQMLVPGVTGLHVAFHLCVLASFTVAGVATWALARRLSLSPAGAFLAGVAFAYCGARMTNLARLHALSSEWVPLALLALLWTLSERRWRGPLLLVGCVAALAWNSADLLAATLVGLAVLLLLGWKDSAPGAAGRLGVAIGMAALLVLPLLPGVIIGLGWPGIPPEVADHERVIASLDLAALLWPNPNDVLLGSLLPTRPVGFIEGTFSFFVGLPLGLLVVAAVALRAPLTRRATWWALAATGLVLSLGPEAKWWEQPLGVPLPWALLDDWLLPLRVSRVPTRFLALVSLPLALMAGAGFDALTQRRPLGSGAVLGLCALLSLGVALDGSERLPLRTLPAYEIDPQPMARALAPLPAGSAILDLPYDDYYVRRFAMFYQTAHGHPILFGAYPRAPGDNRAHYTDIALFAVLSDPELDAEDLAAGIDALDLANERERLRARGIGAIVLHYDVWKLGDPSVRADMKARWKAIRQRLAAAWGEPEKVSAGLYTALVFRL